MGMGMGLGVTRRLSDLRNNMERRICTIGGWWWVIRGWMRLATWPKWRDATSRFAGYRSICFVFALLYSCSSCDHGVHLMVPRDSFRRPSPFHDKASRLDAELGNYINLSMSCKVLNAT